MASIQHWRTRGHKGLRKRNVPMEKGDYGQKKNDEERSTVLVFLSSLSTFGDCSGEKDALGPKSVGGS